MGLFCLDKEALIQDREQPNAHPKAKHSRLLTPLSNAAARMNVTEKALPQMVEAGTIAAIQTPSGELLVAADDNGYQTKEEIIAERFTQKAY